MISAVAFVPAAPLLLPGLTGSPVASVTALRDRARRAVRAVCDASVRRVVVVGTAEVTGPIEANLPGPQAGLRGRPSPDGPTLPVAHAVTLGLLDDMSTTESTEVELLGVDPTAAADECRRLGAALAADPRRTALIVAADGSACRSATAPGYLDPDAFVVDDAICAALGHGDQAALLALEPDRCARLLVDGRAAWQVTAGASTDRTIESAHIDSCDPYGVLYVTGHWRLR